MKKLLLGIFILSVILNICLIRKYLSDVKNLPQNLYDLKPVDKTTGIENFKDRLSEVNSVAYETKKHFFIQTWDTLTLNFESQYIYMKTLDSIAYYYKNTDIGFVFVSQMDNPAIEKFQKNHNFYFKNFICVPDLNDFISSIFIQKKMKFKERTAQFIINKNGDIEYYKNTLFTDVIKDTLLFSNLNKFK
ncbi:MAG: hypothetical protein V4677_09400 [Bacteroidota bacterium]